jgi:predicted RNase H-like nuclease (RuvC/YqgF family)
MGYQFAHSGLGSISMRKAHKIVAVIGAVLFMVASGYGQSLGDVAREQRQKQAKDAHTTHKVVTNEDIPEQAEPVSSTSVSTDEHDTAPPAPASNDTHAGEQWKAKIEAQKSSVASLQSQIDKLNSSIHFVEANRYTNGVQYNQRQVQKQDEVQRLQKQLDEQKKQLEDMQESARKAGLGSSVYEP